MVHLACGSNMSRALMARSQLSRLHPACINPALAAR
jgi:hypothetical protein